MKRVNYFSGMFLTAEDLSTDQQYNREKQKMHNRCLHGYGVVCGLEVALRRGMIHVSPGLGLACTGDEIVVDAPVKVSPPKMKGGTYLTIRFVEREGDPLPSPGKDGVVNSRIEETFEIAFEAHDPCHGHTHLKPSRPTCGRTHSLPLAKLIRSREGWSIDRQFHPPRVTPPAH
jgi:hypothetical protein